MTDDNDSLTAPAASEAVSAATPAPEKKRRRWITPALAVVAALAIGVFGGILISHSSSSATTQAGLPGGFGGGTGASEGGGFAGGNFTAGTIESIDGDTITLKLADGSTVKVTSTSSTTVTKSDTASVSDLKAGETITVAGTKDSDGNVAATTVTEGERAFGGGTPPSGANG